MSEMSEHKMSIDEFAELYGRDKPAGKGWKRAIARAKTRLG